MNILIASNDSVFTGRPVGGAETSMAVLAGELARQGHSVVYLTIEQKGFGNRRSEQHEEGYQIVYLDKLPLSGSIALIKRINQFLLRKRICKTIEQFKIQIAYAFGKMVRTLVDVKVENKMSFQIVLRIAGINPGELFDIKKKDHRINYYLEQVSAFNFQSEAHRKSYLKIRKQNGLNMPIRKELIADIGIHPKFFRERSINKTPGDVISLLCIMRFSTRKRQDLLIDALHHLRSERLRLSLAGDGPNRIILEKKVRDLNMSDQIHFLGHLKSEDIYTLLHSHDILVHPVDYEPQSKVIWEAMASKLPVICSKVPALTDTITNNRTGILVENEVDQWAKVLSEIPFRQRQINEMALNAYTTFRQQADPAINAKTYIHFFSELEQEHA